MMGLAWLRRLFIPPAPAPKPGALFLFRKVNAQRRAHGLATLELHERLGAEAQAFAEAMAHAGRVSHVAPDGSTPYDRFRRAGLGRARSAEVIDVAASAASAIVSWLQSPAHRALLLDPSARVMGTGRAGPYFVVMIATPRRGILALLDHIMIGEDVRGEPGVADHGADPPSRGSA